MKTKSLKLTKLEQTVWTEIHDKCRSGWCVAVELNKSIHIIKAAYGRADWKLWEMRRRMAAEKMPEERKLIVNGVETDIVGLHNYLHSVLGD
jgi:hypothetical protein